MLIRRAFLALASMLPLAALASADEAQVVAKLLADAGVRGGLVVHVGCGDGRLTAALRAGEAYLVQGLAADGGDVARAREHVLAKGLYGPVSIDRWSGGRLPYAENLVRLLVVEAAGVDERELLRVLSPEGVAMIRSADGWRKVVKPRPAEIDEWTHFLHGADNNAVAADRVVGPPQRVQWIAEPKWARSHDQLASISAVVSAAGRLFAIEDEGPTASVALPSKWMLAARDAFSGVRLWQRPVGPWEGHLRGFRSGPADLPRRLVAAGGDVYVSLGYGEPTVCLDAATGATVRTYKGTEGTTEIVAADGVLYVVCGTFDAARVAEADRLGRPTPAAVEKRIVAVRAATGESLWTKADAETSEVMPTTLCVAGGRVFFQNLERVCCLTAATGEPIWTAPRPIPIQRLGWSTPTLVAYGQVVLSADRKARDVSRVPVGEKTQAVWLADTKGGDAPEGELIAYAADTGRKLWAAPCRETYNAPVDVLVADGLVWTGTLVRANDPGITEGRDPLTGEVKRTRSADKKYFNVGMGHHRCYRNKATSEYLVMGRAGVEFIDLKTGVGEANHWVRGACQYGVVPCNGLLYAPSHSCACYIQAKLNGFNALASGKPVGTVEPDEPRLERGPAFGAAAEPPAAAGDWPTYRHDAARSGFTKAAVPADLQQAWSTDLGGRLSAVVVAGGRLYVAQIDAHTVHCLDAAGGQKLWSYTAGGRIDSPPTVHGGLALFGSADGWVYCLAAADGRLAWRFRAAPQDRRVVVYEQVESVWPVPGSVLVTPFADGKSAVAAFVAGRSTFLDGGLLLYRLDAATGKLLSTTHLDGRDPKTGLEPQAIIRGTAMTGVLPDVLSSDGAGMFMRHARFDMSGAPAKGAPHLHSPAGFLDDAWWHRTYWIYGPPIAQGWSAWPTTGNSAPAGRLLVVDEQSVYGFGRSQYGNGIHLGLGKVFYRLFACPKTAAAETPAPKPGQRGRPATRLQYTWTKTVDLQVRAMAVAADTLFIAGPPEGIDPTVTALPKDTPATLAAVATSDGAILRSYALPAPPAFDAMVATAGRLYVATTDGRVLCFAGKPAE